MNSSFDWVGVAVIVATVALVALLLRGRSGTMRPVARVVFWTIVVVVVGVMLWNMSL